jgi:DegV family protein with EDD domain
MAGVRVVTDSACDLSKERAAELGVEVVPLSIRFGDEEYTDGVDLSVEQFYEKLAESEALPETAAPSPGAFADAFRKAKAAGADSVICINLSSDLSATLQSAQNAAEAVKDDIEVRVVDSRSITAGLGTQVRLAAEAGASGASLDEVVALVEDLAGRTKVFGCLDTLDNLKKGGRIGGAQHLLGSLLSIKPIVDVSSGKVEEAGKQRTRKKALAFMRDLVFENETVENLCVYHGAAPDVDDFLDLIEERFPRESVELGTIGPVIGTHGGPRVIGVTFQAGG